MPIFIPALDIPGKNISKPVCRKFPESAVHMVRSTVACNNGATGR